MPRTLSNPGAPQGQRRPILALAAVLLVAGAAQAVPALTDGPDTVIGGPSGESFEGGGGSDSIRGMAGDDIIYGNAGDDSIGGGPGADNVHGGRGRDMINGGQGDDTLAGDRDDDTLTGGLGADRFVFDNLSGSDVITDFDSAAGDRIELPTGMDYTVADTPQGFAIRLGAGGGRLLLADVKFSAVGTWLASPPTAPNLPLQLGPVANPPAAPSKTLLAAIVALSIAFTVLLGIGLVQLVRGGRDRRL